VKKNAFFALFLALTLLILLPVVGSVNISASDYDISASVLVAEGSPGPPPVPSAIHQPVLVAEGSPGPPPVPSAVHQPVFVAEGSPGPPPVPSAIHQPVLVAEGSPGPPPVPNIALAA
jgi:hypothetical protein